MVMLVLDSSGCGSQRISFLIPCFSILVFLSPVLERSKLRGDIQRQRYLRPQEDDGTGARMNKSHEPCPSIPVGRRHGQQYPNEPPSASPCVML